MTMILLNPGPANTTQSVKQAMVVDDICPREREFGDVLRALRDGLAEVVDPSGESAAVLFAGSGTAGVEAAIASVPRQEEGGHLLVLDNGAYGARVAEMARAYELSHEVLKVEIGAPLPLDRVEAMLDAPQRPFSHLAVIHHETTTGMLNPVAAIGAMCRARGVQMIVDAMSSYAAIPMTLDELGASVIVASSNKCIQGMAGMVFCIGKRAYLQQLPRVKGRSLYLDMGEQYRFLESKGQMRYTPPVQIAYALHQALLELREETVAGRRARYDACFEVLDGGMRALGFQRLLGEEQLSRILTAYIEPSDPNYDYDRLHDALYAKGFTIYPGKGAKVGTFRLANMGAITPDDMQRFLVAMRESLRELQITV